MGCVVLTARRRRQATISAWSLRLVVLMERTSSSFWVSQESNKHCQESRLEQRGCMSEWIKIRGGSERKWENWRSGTMVISNVCGYKTLIIWKVVHLCLAGADRLWLHPPPQASEMHPIVCDSIFPMAQNHTVNISVIRAQIFHLQQGLKWYLNKHFAWE